MLTKIQLLENASSTTPGEPVLIAGRLGHRAETLFRTASPAYTAGAVINILLERAEDLSGPWEQISQLPIATDAADKLFTSQMSTGTTVWLRARLDAAPSAGDVSLTLYIDV